MNSNPSSAACSYRDLGMSLKLFASHLQNGGNESYAYGAVRKIPYDNVNKST